MAFGTITVTESTFGSISGTVVGAVPGTLSGSVGVPGPQGPAGPTGPAGAAGQGVPAGGTAGQFLTKIDGTNYNTDWTTLNLSAYAVKANNLSDLTNASTARNNLSLGPTNTVAFRTVNLSEGAVDAGDTLSTLSIATGAGGYGLTASTESFVEGDTSPIVSESGALNLNKNGFYLYRFPTYNTTNPSSPTSGGEMNYVATTGVLTIRAFDTGAATDDTITVEPTGVTFADTTKQTTAFLPADYYTASYIDTTFAPLASPALTGNPTAPTAALGDNDTSIATTAFVQQELLSGTANAKNLEVYVRNQTGSTIPAGSIVYINGATGNRPTVTLAQANNDANSAQTIGFTKTSIANNGFGFVIVRGELENIDTSALTEGVQLYLSPTTAGTWTTTKPSAPQHLVYVGVVIRSHPTLGTILVAVQNGYELNEIHDVALSSEANNDLLTYESSTSLWKNKSFSTLGLATLASPDFTGTPTAPTAAAATNTTQIATTAFVQTSNPDASTTTKGHVELATNAEAVAGTSTTLAVTPNGLEAEIVSPTVSKYFAPAWVGGSIGTGSSALNVFGNQRVIAPTSAVGVALRNHPISQNVRGVNPDNGAVNFSKRIVWGFRLIRYAFGTTDVNSVCRVVLGKTGAVGTPTTRSIGIYFTGTSVLSLMVHDGTTLRFVDTTFTPVHLQGFDAVIISDGTGNVSLFVNGTLAATSANGPVGNSASTPDHRIEAENIAVLTGSPMGAYYSNHTISTEA